jgi:lysozyme
MSVNNFTYGGKGLALTEQFEGCKLRAYRDQKGVWTVGYGHTGPEVVAGLTITRDEAEKFLLRDVQTAATFVNRVVAVQLTQEEFDALVDFVFNLGRGAFQSSQLLRELNAGNLAAAATQFDMWDRAGGAVVAGLLRRRQAETALFSASHPAQKNA